MRERRIKYWKEQGEKEGVKEEMEIGAGKWERRLKKDLEEVNLSIEEAASLSWEELERLLRVDVN